MRGEMLRGDWLLGCGNNCMQLCAAVKMLYCLYTEM